MSFDGKMPAAHAAQPTLESTCEINKLADADLAKIFKHLPPSDRLLISEVCKRWLGISRKAWLDIRHLDLSPIPSLNIGAIVKLCPNLQTVSASGKAFSANQLHVFSRMNLSSFKLYNCSCVIPLPEGDSFDIFSSLFSERFPGAVLTDLVLCGLKARVDGDHFAGFIFGTLPASLERLQLSGVDFATIPDDFVFYDVLIDDVMLFLSDIWRLQNLTCLILSTVHLNPWAHCLLGDVLPEAFLFRALKKLSKLRELCLGWERDDPGQASDLAAVCSLPKLEALILLNAPVHTDDENLKKLATEHPTLRILVIGGVFNGEYSIPVRHLDPNGFNAAPLPLLHVFVGKEASEKILFTNSSAEALVIHPITAPLTDFLEKEEIAPIFDGVWMAAQIKEGAKNGFNGNSFDYSELATSFRQADDV